MAPADPAPFPPRPMRRSAGARVVRLRSGASRLRRTGDPPDDIHLELDHAFHRAYPRTLKVGDGERGESLWLRHRIGRKDWLAWGDEEGPVGLREVFGWLCRGPERLGALAFNEWHLVPGIGRDEFIQEMDAHTDASYALAEAVAAVWPVGALSERGPLLEFSRLWVHPAHARGSPWAPAAQALIRRRYERRSSVMILKAFPIEYEGEVPEGSPLRSACDRRQRAMRRLHARALGMRPFPGELGDEGWMWRPLSAGVPEPTA
jgi:hypothetical protein